jgi:hypothetical protein
MFKKLQRTAVVVSITFIFVMFVAFLLSACSTSSPAPHNKPVMVNHSTSATPLPAPPLAKNMAKQLDCIRFNSYGYKFGHTGTCYINGKQYTIDTFDTKTDLNYWLTETKNFHNLVVRKNDHAVVYLPGYDR